MKERPILFSAPMVRAIIDGRKTQTRRIVKPQESIHGPCDDGNLYWIPAAMQGDPDPNCKTVLAVNKCPYGIPGDRLWVRETHGFGWHDGVGGYSALRPSGKQHDRPDRVFYKADYPDDDEKHGKRCWRPSIHMPRWASRITLEVVDVRVQRLQDITEHDAEREGAATCDHFADAKRGHPTQPHETSFAWLWNKINGRDSWIANPWVWVVEFTRLEEST